MSCCCLKTLNLCSKPICGLLILDKIVGESGESGDVLFTLVLDFLETTVTLSQAQTIGENISFDISMLNESFEYTGQIFDNAGNVVKITSGEVDYDCIKFKTVMNVSL